MQVLRFKLEYANQWKFLEIFVALFAATIVLLPGSASAFSCAIANQGPIDGGIGLPIQTASNGSDCGDPNGLQAQQLRASFDIRDVQPEGPSRFDVPASNAIGVVLTRYHGADDGERADIAFEHSWRPFEGKRIRAVISVPVTFDRVDPWSYSSATSGTDDSGAAYTTLYAGRVGPGHLSKLSIGAGLEIPLTANWSLAPRATYGASFGALGDDVGNFAITESGKTTNYPYTIKGTRTNAEITTLSLVSRLGLRLGRGDLVLANRAAWSASIKTGIVSQPYFSYAHVKSWAFSNGVAYQFLLKGRLLQRQPSLRVSYAWTLLPGSYTVGGYSAPAYYKSFHEAAINLGVRMRETSAKTLRDEMRIGLLYTYSQSRLLGLRDYKALSLTLGYNF